MRYIHAILASLALALFWMPAAKAGEPIKTVYHFNDGRSQAQRALVNIQNHLDADPTAVIAVVAHGAGIDFLLEGAEAADGSPFTPQMEALSKHGVRFFVCNKTLTQRHISKDKVWPKAEVVDSGVAEIARLTGRGGYTYIRP